MYSYILKSTVLFVIFCNHFFASAIEVLPANTLHLKDYNKDSIILKPIDQQKVLDLETYLKKQKNIPFKYLANGCHARTQQAADLISFKYFNSQRVNVAKIVIEPKNEDDTILYKSESGPWQLNWAYHMAPVVNVNGKLFVFDLSLFDHAVPYKQWLDKALKDVENVKDYKHYYINQFTFRPSLKNKRFTQLPRQYDFAIGGFLAQFSSDYEKNGAFMQNCILKNENGSNTVGGVPLDELPSEYYNHHLPYCEGTPSS